MSSAVKTVLATGASSGIGFELVKQLLQKSEPYRFILGCRNPTAAQKAFEGLEYDAKKHQVDVLPLDLTDLKTVKSFAAESLKQLGSTKLDYVLLNAGMIKESKGPSPTGSQWCESYVVNHLSQHYLVHLLRHKIEESHSRLVVVTSGIVRGERDTSSLTSILKADSGASHFEVYAASKFTQLLGALWWKRQLPPSCPVIAVSPGMIPNTGLARHMDIELPDNLPDTKSVPEGASSVVAAFTRDDFPSDPSQIVLASWGDWWEGNTYKAAFDHKLQDAWSPSKEQIEKEENV